MRGVHVCMVESLTIWCVLHHTANHTTELASFPLFIQAVSGFVWLTQQIAWMSLRPHRGYNILHLIHLFP